MVSELQHLMEYDVFQTLTSEQLERCCPIEKEITRVIVHVQAKTNESAKDTNIQDINNFKTKVFKYPIYNKVLRFQGQKESTG